MPGWIAQKKLKSPAVVKWRVAVEPWKSRPLLTNALPPAKSAGPRFTGLGGPGGAGGGAVKPDTGQVSGAWFAGPWPKVIVWGSSELIVQVTLSPTWTLNSPGV